MILIQSGATHGTMVERLVEVIGSLRNGVGEPDDASSRLEGIIGRTQDLGVRRHRAYLREIEAEICDLIDQPFMCPGDIHAK